VARLILSQLHAHNLHCLRKQDPRGLREADYIAWLDSMVERWGMEYGTLFNACTPPHSFMQLQPAESADRCCSECEGGFSNLLNSKCCLRNWRSRRIMSGPR